MQKSGLGKNLSKLKKKLTIKADARKMRQLEAERNLINAESALGRGLFGQVAPGHQREFFCLQKNVWIWYESWLGKGGAPEEIMYDYKPHIGTDKLREVVINLRNKIISYGGEFRYQTKLTDLIIKDNKVVAVIDLDSHLLANYSKLDQEILEKIADKIAKLF